MWPDREVGYSGPFDIEIKNEWNYTFPLSYDFIICIETCGYFHTYLNNPDDGTSDRNL